MLTKIFKNELKNKHHNILKWATKGKLQKQYKTEDNAKQQQWSQNIRLEIAS